MQFVNSTSFVDNSSTNPDHIANEASLISSGLVVENAKKTFKGITYIPELTE